MVLMHGNFCVFFVKNKQIPLASTKSFIFIGFNLMTKILDLTLKFRFKMKRILHLFVFLRFLNSFVTLTLRYEKTQRFGLARP